MDIDDMALIGPGVNLSEIPPIHQKRTLAFVNTFITNTVSILNNLSRTSEIKMQKFEEKLQRMDASLCILEAKLSSIPGLNSMPLATPVVTAIPQQIEEKINNAPQAEVSKPEVEVESKSLEPQEPSVEATADDSTMPDPQYTKFFKMVQFGVPPQAAKLKMMSEGLDPNILDNPKSVPRVPKLSAESAVSSESEDSD